VRGAVDLFVLLDLPLDLLVGLPLPLLLLRLLFGVPIDAAATHGLRLKHRKDARAAHVERPTK